ncbi:TetR/AcrR family transcriptional regulator C-terminal domain-containing protein [Ruminococcus sp.]|uniref:TetR/AcrR family transcriptional regulator C-terminal domain-containing protein n=1 Tax=Ruminococcus sp. TaxID=41978 RepID=UPI0025EB5555|nr:TetR/AcrR family transcriptional regulator C-terminal domain-containing protein [Ruminococcus sp.]
MSSSAITKGALCDALKKLCEQKPFDKISISDITGECGLNRQSFYYHFQDKYELLAYIYFNDLFINITKGVNYDNWYERLEGFLDHMQQDKKFYSNTLKCSEKIFENYLFKSMHKLFIRFFYHAVATTRKRSDKAKFFADFYSHGFCGIIIDWATSGMKDSPHDVMLQMKDLALENVNIGEGFRQNL